MKRISRAGEISLEVTKAGRNSLGGLTTNFASDNDGSVPLEYPFRLNTYLVPPDYDVTVEQFEEYAFARLQLLKAVENASMKFQREDEIAKAIKSAEDKWMALHANESAAIHSLFDERRRDHASHFILRLTFCNTADNIRWFVTQECLLFRTRFASEMSKERTEFLRKHNAHLTPLNAEEKLSVIEQLKKCSPGREMDDFFKVPFEYAPDLVARRLIFIKGGLAYVPKSDSFAIIMTRFKESLERWMERTARELPSLRDDRLLPILQLIKTFDSSTTDQTRGVVEGKVTAEDMDSASIHFPPCMLQLYTKGKQDNHLKYGGRQQLGLFLKGIGMPMEEAIIFWRRLFVPKCGDDGFSKNYLYNIRHNYGQEGKRANYGPYSCSKVILGSTPGPGDAHGCPFRHSSPDNLKSMLTSYSGPLGVPLQDHQVNEITEMARNNHCQGACTRLFEYTRLPDQPTGHLETFAYPSKFFEASVRLLKKHNGPQKVQAQPKL